MKKNILITGSSTGIGYAIAEGLAKKGNNIFLVSKNKKRLIKAKNKIKKINSNIVCDVLACDISKKNSPNKIYKIFIKKYKKIHVLVNNVGGGSKEEGNDFNKTTEKNFDLIYKKNIFSTYRLTQLSLKSMMKNNWGRIITITSNVTQKFSGKPIYKMNKIAQISLMKSLSTQRKYTKKNITFNCISPGAIFTETSKWSVLKKKNPKLLKRIIKRDFPKGIGSPVDVANVVNFLSLDESNYVNGTNIIVDGGNINTNNVSI